MTRVEELTLKLLDGTISDAESDELETLVARDDDAARLHLSLLEQEAALRGLQRPGDVTEATLARIREAMSDRVEQGVMRRIRGPRSNGESGSAPQPVESDWRWIGTRPFWNSIAAILIVAISLVLLDYRRNTAARAMPQEAFIYGQWDVTPGMETAWRVFVRNGGTAEPVGEARVVPALYDAGSGSLAWKGEEIVTDRFGYAQIAAAIPAGLDDGAYTLRVRAASDAGESVIEREVRVRRSFRVLVTTDKPLYQPGQTIRIRTLSLAAADRHPVRERPIRLEVSDAKGNKVFGRDLSTSEFGIAAADFRLADQVNQGEYTIAAILGDSRSERTVRVERYVLPKLAVTVTTDRGFYAPGEVVTGEVTARYTFGKPVVGGRVAMRALEYLHDFVAFRSLSGETDGDGGFRFEAVLKEKFHALERGRSAPSVDVSLEATVTDRAGHAQTALCNVTVTGQPIRIDAIAESGMLVPDVENILYVVTSYPDGRPAQTTVTLNGAAGFRTSEYGVAAIRVKPEGGRLDIAAEDDAGLKASVIRSLDVDRSPGSFLLRTDRAVYACGDTATLDIFSNDGWTEIFVDVIHDGRTVSSRRVDVRNFRGNHALDLPFDLYGTVELVGYRIRPNGDIVTDRRVIQVLRPEALTIEATLDREIYAPAGEATLRFLVKGADGKPARAALGLAAVDEAVFALCDMRPGLEGVYFALQKENLEPRYEIHGVLPVSAAGVIDRWNAGPPDIVPDAEREVAVTALYAAAAGESWIERSASASYKEKQAQIGRQKKEYRARLGSILLCLPGALYLLLLLPLIFYGLAQLFRSEPIVGLSQRDVQNFRQAAMGLFTWWGAGAFFPILIMAGAIVLGGGPGDLVKVLVPVVIAGSMIALTTLLALKARTLRRTRAAAAAPLFRKWVALLPYSYIPGICGALIIARAGEAGDLPSNSSGILVIVLWCAAFLTGGALLASARALTRSRAAAMRFFEVPAFVLVCALPAVIGLLLLFATMLPQMGSAVGVDGARPLARFDGGALRALGYATESEMDPATAEAVGKDSGSPAPGAGEPPRVRRHFPETLVWMPEVITDGAGRAEVTVPLADSITTWRLSTSAVSARGELGGGQLPIRVFQDFFVDFDLPVALTRNDAVSVPVAVYNYSDREQTVNLVLEPQDWFELRGPLVQVVTVAPSDVAGVGFDITAKEAGSHTLTITGSAGELADAVERVVRVEPDGLPVTAVRNGRLDGPVEVEIAIPERAIDGASDLFVKIYPGAFSQIVEGLDAILAMPYGCFEQTSSVTYPNVLALATLRATGRAKPAVEMKALEYIGIGWQRLLSFEVDGGGFDWFGNPPANTVLTAYGLMEFGDMSRVFEVDGDVIERTREWLFRQQGGDGTWNPDRRGIAEGAVNSFRGEQLRTTAYVAWAILESNAALGERPGSDPRGRHDRRRGRIDLRLGKALDAIAEGMTGTEDVYTLALCANALLAGGRDAQAAEVLGWLEGFMKEEGDLVHWESSSQGLTYSYGDAIHIETTALAAYAFLGSDRSVALAHKALAWLVSKKDARGTWYSTQATVHAMRALLRGYGEVPPPSEPFTVAVDVHGETVREITIDGSNADVRHLVSLKDSVREGMNRIGLSCRSASGTTVPAGLAWQVVGTHYEPWAAPGEPREKELAIDLAWSTTELERSDILDCAVTVTWNRPGSAMMTIVDLGIPPGFAVLPDALDALREQGVIEKYTLSARQATLYFREIVGGRPVRFNVPMKAKYPVTVKTPPSTVYQYYEPTLRDQAQPVEIRVF